MSKSLFILSHSSKYVLFYVCLRFQIKRSLRSLYLLTSLNIYLPLPGMYVEVHSSRSKYNKALLLIGLKPDCVCLIQFWEAGCSWYSMSQGYFCVLVIVATCSNLKVLSAIIFSSSKVVSLRRVLFIILSALKDNKQTTGNAYCFYACQNRLHYCLNLQNASKSYLTKSFIDTLL